MSIYSLDIGPVIYPFPPFSFLIFLHRQYHRKLILWNTVELDVEKSCLQPNLNPFSESDGPLRN